jgi:VanZ family protein
MSVIFRWMAWLLLGAVAVFTLCPIALRPVTSAPADLERALAFALIGGAFCLGYPKHRLAVVLLVIGLAGLLEAAQNLVPGRHGQMHDLTVKVFSAVAGALTAALLERAVTQAFSHKGRLSRS